ncbi:MAG TPA: RNA polymerase sigma factor [Candidatus Didemnitutus sp.]|nr:RNA polymerase sigma factor [Candidatus Didemnitutus sp.]
MDTLAIAHAVPLSSDRPTIAALPPMSQKPESLAALFEAEESALLYFALGMVRRRSVAEELVQEAFLRLHQSWTEVENPRGWLYRSIRNLALNHLRDHPAESELPEATPSETDSLPADLLARNEAIGMVRLVLADLPAEDRELVRLKYHDGLKYDEISRRTGLSVGNVGYRLHHLMKALAESLRNAGIEGSEG